MKFSTNTAIIGLLVICLNPIKLVETEKSKEIHDLLTAGLPPIASAIGFLAPPPVGPVLSGSLFLIHAAITFMKGINAKDEFDYDLSIMKRFEKIDQVVVNNSHRIIEELNYIIKSTEFLREMRQSLEEIQRTYSDNFYCVVAANCSGKTKEDFLDEMLKYSSDYRRKLRTFISSFIQPLTALPILDPEHLFFDLLQERYKTLTKDGNDCLSEASHYRVFKAYLHIMGVLSNGNSLVAAAHGVRYKRNLEEKKKSDAVTIRRENMKIMKEFLKGVLLLMRRVRVALNRSSRDIRNCGTFDLQKGITYERLDFIMTRFSFSRGSEEVGCKVFAPDDVSNDGYNVYNCIELHGNYKFFIDPKNLLRPYHHIENLESHQLYGRNDYSLSLKETAFPTYKECLSQRCSAYKKKLYRFSNKAVGAQPGYVITGIRWRVKDHLIYFEIQEAEYISVLDVDISTVQWKETPLEKKHEIFLDNDTLSIIIDDISLPPNYFVTSVQMFLNKENIIDLKIIGLPGSQIGMRKLYDEPKNVNSTRANRPRHRIELKIGDDDPAFAPANSKNLMTRDTFHHFVKFQATNFFKDGGRTTVPYLDIREIFTKPPAPISGIGIYHEAVPGFGGFLALKLISPNLTYLVDEEKFEGFMQTLFIDNMEDKH